MSSSTITALHSTVTSASGRITHRVSRSDRKVSRQSTPTETNSARFTHLSAAWTASFVAAITPTLPLASRNVIRSVSPPAALNACTRSTIFAIVVAW